MNKICCFILLGSLFIHINTLQSQISEGGLPPSFSYKQSLRSATSTTRIPVSFNVEDLKLVDQWQVSQGAPLRVATLIHTDLNISNDGTWHTLPGGETICQLNIQAEGAVALMLYYKEFYIPQGGKLFIYNAGKTHLIGAFTHQSNPVSGKFASEFVAGDDIILEYVAAPSGEKPRLHIEDIGYGYNHLYVTGKPSLRSENSCEVNINCEEGNDWQTEKKGVCKMVQRIGTESYLCSASLINNTAQDFKPYILSAQHCSSNLDEAASESDYNQWVFYFHYERSECDNDSQPATYQTMVGCRMIASTPIHGGSDGLLLLLNQNIPDDYYVYYNGWDRRNTPATSGVSIHHPEGEYKKISTFTSHAVSTSWLDKDDNEGAKNAHWNVIFSETANGHGVTAGGSSGSPLFNQDKLIVGTLSGGSSSCEKTDGINLYGKLFYHWNQHGRKTTERMDVWLDPLNTGAERLQGRYKKEPVVIETPRDFQLAYVNNEVRLDWKAPPTQRPIRYNVYREDGFIGNTTALSYTDKPGITGSIIYSVSAVYANNVESPVVSKTVYIAEYLAPSNPTATFSPNYGVVLSWEAPLYTQTIYWGTGTTAMSLGFSGVPFYFGQSWSASDIAPLANKTLQEVQFAPVRGATYSLLITQGNRKYTQEITNSAYGKLNSIPLKTPFTIGSRGSLVVAVFVSKYDKDEYPAYCDSGPAVTGKGNLVSTDGVNWKYLSDDDFNVNFFLAAVITSEERTVASQSHSEQDINITRSDRKPLLRKTTPAETSLRSFAPAAFPAITGYNIYRDNRKINAFPVTATRYVDALLGAEGTFSYSVSALYNGIESGRTTIKGNVVVGNEQLPAEESAEITPTRFGNYITITNAETVKRLEIISMDGKLVKSVELPGNTVNTSSLAKGLYIFRLITTKEVKVIRAVKQ